MIFEHDLGRLFKSNTIGHPIFTPCPYRTVLYPCVFHVPLAFLPFWALSLAVFRFFLIKSYHTALKNWPFYVPIFSSNRTVKKTKIYHFPLEKRVPYRFKRLKPFSIFIAKITGNGWDFLNGTVDANNFKTKNGQFYWYGAVRRKNNDEKRSKPSEGTVNCLW